MSEPNVGNVSYFKVFSGTLNSGDDLVNAENGTVERINQMFISEGKNREMVNQLRAGDIGVTVKLKNSHTLIFMTHCFEIRITPVYLCLMLNKKAHIHSAMLHTEVWQLGFSDRKISLR